MGAAESNRDLVTCENSDDMPECVFYDALQRYGPKWFLVPLYINSADRPRPHAP